MKQIAVILFLCLTASLVAQKKDTLSFQKKPFQPTKDTSYNSTYYELQKYNAFHQKTAHIKSEKKYLEEIHSFTKDSLQILAVKLISIKQLYKKDLLDTDIAQHTNFYVALLNDLKESDINPTEYLFLENKLSKILIAKLETKYTYSSWLNTILAISLAGAFVFMFYSRRKKNTPIALSKQETTVKNLIVNGKSNKEIAEELFISLSTVKTHITNIYHKLHISNRDELTAKFKNTTSTST